MRGTSGIRGSVRYADGLHRPVTHLCCAGLVKPVHEIRQIARCVTDRSLDYIVEIGDHRFEPKGLKADESASPHSTDDDGGAVGHTGGHPAVLVFGHGTEAVIPGLIIMSVSDELAMTDFVPQFGRRDLTILDGDNEVVSGATEVLGHGLSITGGNGDFHGRHATGFPHRPNRRSASGLG